MSQSAAYIDQSKRILISCGELSGDEHAAHLVEALRKFSPSVQIRAMGGRCLRAAGVETIVDSETSASVMGFTEVLGSLAKIFRALQTMKAAMRSWKPQVLILIDFPDFNFRLAKYASSQGIKVLYYISPQVWAWRSGRVEFFKKYIDRIAVIFPFEQPFLESKGYNKAVFVGHPLPDYLHKRPLRNPADLKKSLGLNNSPVLAVFPGSRKSEIKRNFAVLLEGLKKFSTKYPLVQIVMNIAPSLNEGDFENVKAEMGKIILLKENPLDIMSIADAALLKSGTSNLQAAMLGLPFAMFYMTSIISAFLARRLLNIKEYCIVNILQSGTVKEILQEEATADNISNELENLFNNEAYRKQMKDKFKKIADSLLYRGNNSLFESCENTPERTAKLVLELADYDK